MLLNPIELLMLIYLLCHTHAIPNINSQSKPLNPKYPVKTVVIEAATKTSSKKKKTTKKKKTAKDLWRKALSKSEQAAIDAEKERKREAKRKKRDEKFYSLG